MTQHLEILGEALSAVETWEFQREDDISAVYVRSDFVRLIPTGQILEALIFEMVEVGQPAKVLKPCYGVPFG